MGRAEDFRLRRVFPLLSRLGPAAYPLATRIGLWGREGDANAAIAVANGLRRVYPDMPQARVDELCRGYRDMMAREQLDTFMLAAGREGWLRESVMLSEEHLAAMAEAHSCGNGVILVLAHYGRLIMLAARLAQFGYRMGMLTMQVDLQNPDLSPAFRDYMQLKTATVQRCIGGGGWRAVGESMRPIYQGLARGEIWVVLMDAWMPQFSDLRSFPFLGGALSLPRGIERIAERTGARLVYGSVREVGGARLQGRLCHLPGGAQQAMACAVTELERDVLADPAQWWQWNILDYLWQSGEAA